MKLNCIEHLPHADPQLFICAIIPQIPPVSLGTTLAASPCTEPLQSPDFCFWHQAKPHIIREGVVLEVILCKCTRLAPVYRSHRTWVVLSMSYCLSLNDEFNCQVCSVISCFSSKHSSWIPDVNVNKLHNYIQVCIIISFILIVQNASSI